MTANLHEPPPPAGAGGVVAPAPGGAAAFFSVSQAKLVVMSFCTLGLYQYYWFYKNWRLVRDRTGENISPAWRAVFTIFYCYSLFNRVRNHDSQSPASGLSAGALAAGWIVLTLLANLPDPYWLVYFVSIFVLTNVQAAINASNLAASPNHDQNARFSAWNWVAVVLGGLVFVLAVIGTFLPPP